MSEELNSQLRWYVIHTYSGYENKVKTNIEKLVENSGLEDYIKEVSVPMEEAVEIKNGVKKTVQRKKFPGYVLLKMIMNDDTWYVVRNTRGVTGFVGPASKPVPLSDKEVEALGIDTVNTVVEINIKKGDKVKISAGPMEGFVGEVKDINTDDMTVDVSVSMFGRETLATIEISKVSKADKY